MFICNANNYSQANAAPFQRPWGGRADYFGASEDTTGGFRVVWWVQLVGRGQGCNWRFSGAWTTKLAVVCLKRGHFEYYGELKTHTKSTTLRAWHRKLYNMGTDMSSGVSIAYSICQVSQTRNPFNGNCLVKVHQLFTGGWLFKTPSKWNVTRFPLPLDWFGSVTHVYKPAGCSSWIRRRVSRRVCCRTDQETRARWADRSTSETRWRRCWPRADCACSVSGRTPAEDTTGGCCWATSARGSTACRARPEVPSARSCRAWARAGWRGARWLTGRASHWKRGSTLVQDSGRAPAKRIAVTVNRDSTGPSRMYCRCNLAFTGVTMMGLKGGLHCNVVASNTSTYLHSPSEA